MKLLVVSADVVAAAASTFVVIIIVKLSISSASDSESDGSDSTSAVNFFSLAKQFSLDVSFWFKKCITAHCIQYLYSCLTSWYLCLSLWLCHTECSRTTSGTVL